MRTGPSRPRVAARQAFFRRLGLALVAITTGFFALTIGGTSAQPPPDRLVVPAQADAHVDTDRPRARFGLDAVLHTGARGSVVSYLRFEVPESWTDEPASLKLFARSGGAFRVFEASDTAWTESRINARNAPGLAREVARSRALAHRWNDVPIPSPPAGSSVTLALVSGARDEVVFSSRQGRHAPRLVQDRPPSASASDSPTPLYTFASPTEPVVVAVGDIACEPPYTRTDKTCRMEDTAAVTQALYPSAVLTLGDNQYEEGTYEEFIGSFDGTWGRFNDIVRPSVGNHEYLTPQASGYFDYFGERAGPRDGGYYSFDLAGWHFIALNSNCAIVSCRDQNPQLTWLRQDLLQSSATCTVAYWHHPRFSSGRSNDQRDAVLPFWRELHGAGADLVLNGHEHNYERFAPQDPTGAADSESGLRQFVVGTGGFYLTRLSAPVANSEFRQDVEFGVLALTLRPSSYEWMFATEKGDVLDRGTGTCH